MATATDKDKDVENIEKTETPPSKKGLLCMWQGYSGDIRLQTFPQFATRQIRRVALGGEHCLFLSSDLQVFSCGSNRHGQLGLGTLDVRESPHPQLIESLSGSGVIEVACGKHHSGAVCENGDVYCWGNSNHGQCGVEMSAVTSPFHVEIVTKGEVCEHGIRLPDRRVCMKKLACGAEHTIALSCDSSIWVWGTGIQLGLGETTHASKPQQLSSIVGRTVVDICCGDAYSMVLVEKSDKDTSAYVRPKQTATVAKIQKHFPSQCAACNKEIYTYTETDDTCIIDEAHDCQDSLRQSMESSCGSISAEPSLNDCNVPPSNQNLSECQRNTVSSNVAPGNQNLSECQRSTVSSKVAPANQKLSECQKSSSVVCKNIPSSQENDVQFGDSVAKQNFPVSDRLPVESRHHQTHEKGENSKMPVFESISSVDSQHYTSQNERDNSNFPLSESLSSVDSQHYGNRDERQNLNISVSDSLLSVDSQHFCNQDEMEISNLSVCLDTSCIGDYKIHNELTGSESLSRPGNNVELQTVFLDPLSGLPVHQESDAKSSGHGEETQILYSDTKDKEDITVATTTDSTDNKISEDVVQDSVRQKDMKVERTKLSEVATMDNVGDVQDSVIQKDIKVERTKLSEVATMDNVGDVQDSVIQKDIKVERTILSEVAVDKVKDVQDSVIQKGSSGVESMTLSDVGDKNTEDLKDFQQLKDTKQEGSCKYTSDVPELDSAKGVVNSETQKDTNGEEMLKSSDIANSDSSLCAGGSSKDEQACKDVGSSDDGELREVLCLSVRPEDCKQLKKECKASPREVEAEKQDAVVWRRMVSLEAEMNSQTEENKLREGLETATYLEGGEEENETSVNSTFQSTLQSFLPYSSAMLQTMKSMTSQTLSSIQMSMSYVTKQTAGLGSASDIDTALMDTSSPLASLTTSLDSLSEGTQDSSFIDGRLVKENSSGTESPAKEYSPVKDPSPDGSRVSKKSQSLRTVWAKQDQLEKISSPSACHQGEQNKISGRSSRGHQICTNTEVWVWGENKKGQLGVGDSIDRSKPSCIKMFSSRSVVKLAAGSSHSLALTAVGQVYSWGNNAYGQLGQTETTVSPIRIKFIQGSHIWDIAAGKTHSLFLADSCAIKPHVFFCGKQPAKDVYSTVIKSTVPIQLPHLKKAGWLRQVSAGGDNCACLLDNTSTMVKILYEFAASERYFFHNLNKIEIFFLKPLMKSSFFTSLDVYPYKSSVHDLVTANINLTHHVCKLLTELTFAIRDGLDICEVSQFRNFSYNVNMFRKYSQRLADFIAIGGFKYITKVGGPFFDKIQDLFRKLLDDKVDPGNHATNFRLALLQPVLKVKEYAKLTSKLSENTQQGSESACLLKKVALNWESLKMISANELAHADRTCAFWETASPKVADMLRIPNRRLLRESKSHPLVFPTSGRFSSSLFLLFNDIFVHTQNSIIQVFSVETMWVETPESDTVSQTGLVVTTPEETLDLIAASPAGKAEWLMALNSAINKVLSTQKSSSSSDRHGSHERLTPPLIRHASYTFTKSGPYKDAVYTGSWLNGKLHGYGELKWQDGRKHVGRFKHGLQHGHGILSIPKGVNSEETHEGNWKDGKLNGHAIIRYVNGDSYEGCFKEGQRFGHGIYKQGQHMSSIASIYIGEWLQDKRCGYGVQDDILKGEKYMGTWQDDCRHGKGIVVTLDGMYFEGNFVHNKLSGNGLMLTDDNSCYEGEFQDITQLQGKGTLILPTGDKIEGHFSGSWNEGLKINGTFIKNVDSPDRRAHHSQDTNSRFYSKLSVPADKKWEDIFRHCSLLLGYIGQGKADTAKAWEAVAIMITAGRDTVKERAKTSPNKARVQLVNLENLEIIPPHNSGNLTIEEFLQISCYLHKAFDTTFHPFGKLMDNLVDVFRAAYIGVGAHPRLLFHAVEEVRSYIRRIYAIIRLLFPDLPANGGPIFIYPATSQQKGIPRSTEEAERFFQYPTQQMESQETSEVVTRAGILYPLLLPKIYPPLFDLYALFNDKEDERYWERIMKLNRQGDVALMAYLGVEQKFWLLDEELFHDKSQKLSQIREECYASAVDMLQQIGTAFSPIDKLKVLEETFLQITKTVQASLKEDHVWCLDDLFPIFQFVVVRAQIRHLGAEIHLIHDLMEDHMQYGELGVMATTLNACYFQIQTEKLSMH